MSSFVNALQQVLAGKGWGAPTTTRGPSCRDMVRQNSIPLPARQPHGAPCEDFMSDLQLPTSYVALRNFFNFFTSSADNS